jgi:hypothetical protein
MHFIIIMHCCMFFNTTLVCFDKKSNGKKTSTTTSFHPNVFGYMEHSLKPLQPIEEVVVEVFFFFNFPNFVTLKNSSRRCFSCSVLFKNMTPR